MVIYKKIYKVIVCVEGRGGGGGHLHFQSFVVWWFFLL